MTLRLTTWNINSLRLRLGHVARLIDEARPDILCLQETKVPDHLFPGSALGELGYPHQVFYGIKGHNGVAILSRRPLSDPRRHDWCGREDGRHVSARLDGGPGGGVELHNIYVPAGGDRPDPEANGKFAHKLDFLDEVSAWFGGKKGADSPLILVGDLNIAPLETDVWSHERLLTVVSHTPVEVARLERLQETLGWVDAVRDFIPPKERLYSWWSYRARDWRAGDRGRRLDHIWVTPPLRANLKGAEVLKRARDWEKPSDHVPVMVDLEI